MWKIKPRLCNMSTKCSTFPCCLKAHNEFPLFFLICVSIGEHRLYQGTDKSLARPEGKQARKHVRDMHDFNNTEKRAVIKCFCLQGKAPKEIHAILTETFTCFLPGRAKNLSAPLYESYGSQISKNGHLCLVLLHLSSVTLC